MLDFLVGLMIYAFWFAVFMNFVVLFGLRLIHVVKEQAPVKRAFAILFLPFSIGYFVDKPQKSLLHTIYQICLWLLFVSIAIGAVMMFYAHFA